MAHRLVDHRMVVRVGINAVAPHIAPAVRAKRLFDQQFRVGGTSELDAAAIKDERQLGIVGNPAVVANRWVIGVMRLVSMVRSRRPAAGSFYRRFR